MLISRGATTLTTLTKLRNAVQPLKQAVRNSSHTVSYRCAPPKPSQTMVRIAEGVQGFAWWWVLWHLWTEPGHIIGEFEYPDASKWTDEELGIPSD